MGNIIPFELGNGVPAHIARRYAGNTSNVNNDLASGISAGYPVISYKGKVWRVNQGGVETIVTNEDGDPRASIDVVIIKANPLISKIYYASGYVEGSTEKPDCYSNDGVAPAADAAEPQSSKCAICQFNQWGSRITENNAKGKACSDSRRMAVAAVNDLKSPMLLRAPAATLKELAAYKAELDKIHAPYQAVVTRVGFDHAVAHPKLTFRAIRWLSDEELDTVSAVGDGDIVQSIVAGAVPLAAETHVGDLGERPVKNPEPKPAAKGRAGLKAVEPEPAAKPVARKPRAAAPDAAPAEKSSKLASVLSDASAELDALLASMGSDDS